MRFVLGIDEAGRGPLAGPLAIGAVAVPEKFIITREFPGLADSKQVAPMAREKLFALMRRRMRKGDFQFCVRYTSAQRIDAWGLSRAAQSAVSRAIRFLSLEPNNIFVYLDGLLKAPPEYAQQTIIGGDEAVPVIALASIAAKVARDRLMTQLAKEFPQYGFEVHKGYGTKAHYEALKKHGLCAIHRRSFIHFDSEEK